MESFIGVLYFRMAREMGIWNKHHFLFISEISLGLALSWFHLNSKHRLARNMHKPFGSYSNCLITQAWCSRVESPSDTKSGGWNQSSRLCSTRSWETLFRARVKHSAAYLLRKWFLESEPPVELFGASFEERALLLFPNLTEHWVWNKGRLAFLLSFRKHLQGNSFAEGTRKPLSVPEGRSCQIFSVHGTRRLGNFFMAPAGLKKSLNIVFIK